MILSATNSRNLIDSYYEVPLYGKESTGSTINLAAAYVVLFTLILVVVGWVCIGIFGYVIFSLI